MENCWEEAPHSSQDCYPHYNLFQSSIFYDTDNFRVSYLLEDCLPSESSENEERTAEPPDKPPEVPPCKAKRVISKHELYKDPDLFRNEDGQSNSNGPIEPPRSPPQPQPQPQLQPWGYDWTKQSWVKAGAPVLLVPRTAERTATTQNKAPRVNNSKAESMMVLMGWRGGALGARGDGIVEPLVADPVTGFRSSSGLGDPARGAGVVGVAPAAPAAPATPGGRRPDKRDHFRANLLLHVLEFVQDDSETELLFDPGLRAAERRRVTSVVHSVLHDVSPAGLARDIHARNKYVLQCVCTHNQLAIYKEAPEDVYLVTPDDFLAKDDADDTSNKSDTGDKPHISDKTNGELEDDENPFLKSIKKSIKKDDEPKSITNKFETDCVIAKEEVTDRKSESPVTPADKMLEFFLEFAETDAYKEMRFLGSFTAAQSSAITALLADVARWSRARGGAGGHTRGGAGGHTRGGAGGEGGVARALRAAAFSVRDGINGTPEIHKVPASPRQRVENT